jgi:hypothetical protein
VQKYWPSICQPSNREMHPSLVKANSDEMPIKHLNAQPVYLASDVDARIAELEDLIRTGVVALRQGASIQPGSGWHDKANELMESRS